MFITQANPAGAHRPIFEGGIALFSPSSEDTMPEDIYEIPSLGSTPSDNPDMLDPQPASQN